MTFVRGGTKKITRSIGVVATLVGLVAFTACGHAPSSRPTPSAISKATETAKQRARRTPPPPEWYWEIVDSDVRTPSRKALELPVAETSIARIEGATRIWDELSPEARERLRRDGVLVTFGADATPTDLNAKPGDAGAAPSTSSSRSMGAFYTDLREQRIPQLITIDALFALVHIGLERALAEVEETDLAPTVQSLATQLEARLAKEEATVTSTDVVEPFRIARGIIAVARALSLSSPETATNAPAPPRVAAKAGGAAGAGSTLGIQPESLANLVAEEKSRVEAHAGLATSALLGVPIDYARFAVPSNTARPGTFRALAWLSAAPLALVARHEAPGSSIDVTQARRNTRAAMLLARSCDRDVDPAIHAVYTHALKLLSFVWGTPDDLSLTEIDELSDQAGLDLRKPDTIWNVARVDKLRARAVSGRAPAAYDASGGAFRGGISARVFGGHAAADSLALQGLVGAPAGLAQESAASAPVDRLRNGRRVLPATLDIAAWLGAPEARSALREAKADAFDGFDAALQSAQRTRPKEESVALHASVHGSLVDALLAAATPESASVIRPTAALNRLRVESILSSWTLIRHAGQALSRPKLVANAPPLSSELRVSGGPLPVFVEAAPETIARLVGSVRQMRRGFEVLGHLAPQSNGTAILVEIEDILKVAQKGAERHASDEALLTEEASALASLPARLSRIEDAVDPDLVGPVVALVYSDPVGHRSLVSATGKIEPVIALAREAGREEAILVVGAHVAHHEIVEADPTTTSNAASKPAPWLTDAVWRARMKATPNAAPRAAFTASFRMAR